MKVRHNKIFKKHMITRERQRESYGDREVQRETDRYVEIQRDTDRLRQR